MFKLFSKEKSVDEILKDVNLTPPWQWNPTQTPISYTQAQENIIEQFLKENHDLKCENQKLKNDIHQPELCNEKISELTKEVNGLRHLKQENADLMEMLAKYRDGYQGSCYACEPVGILNQKQEKEIDFLKKKLQIIENDYKKCAEQRDEYKHQLNAANKDIKAQKHPMYPIHWGGYTDETPWETAAADLALRVVKLERKVEELTLIKNVKTTI
jgi:DNA repair exonuclease SbcCD ATPase subunit